MMYAKLRFASFFFFALSSLRVHAQGADSSSWNTFEKLLSEHKRLPQLQSMLGEADKVLLAEPLDLLSVKALPQNVLLARYKEFNESYLLVVRKEKQFESELAILKNRLDQTPVTNSQQFQELELKVKVRESDIKKVKSLIFMRSVTANRSIREALKTIPAAKQESVAQQKKAEQDKSQAPPMPGVYGGSAAERRRMKQSEKLNLTPVDPEFYATQLGKKLEKDLDGRADFWSYDFDKDELYVSVNNGVGKVQIKTDPSGGRFIQTRSGTNFLDLKGADTRVDASEAKGKFLTGKATEENLFGDFPEGAKDKTMNEADIKKPGSGSGTHDHKH